MNFLEDTEATDGVELKEDPTQRLKASEKPKPFHCDLIL